MKFGKAAKIAAAKRLIEHHGTPDGEREAAKRAYKRLTGRDYEVARVENPVSEYEAPPAESATSGFDGHQAISTVDWMHAEYDAWSTID